MTLILEIIDLTRLSAGGNDKINAAQGDDELTGGSGADKFKCGSGDDTVTDFNEAEDKASGNCEIIE